MRDYGGGSERGRVRAREIKGFRVQMTWSGSCVSMAVLMRRSATKVLMAALSLCLFMMETSARNGGGLQAHGVRASAMHSRWSPSDGG